MIRGFKIARGYENMDIKLPVRSTMCSAGYDIMSAEDIVIPAFKEGMAPVFVKTGIKSYMPDDEYLMLCNRSSNPKKKGLVLSNGVGIVDADYYENPNNDGLLMFAFYNISDKDILVKKGDRIGQGIFMKYLLADNDEATGKRTGGFGSTGNN